MYSLFAPTGPNGGFVAVMNAIFSLAQGEVLNIAVGGQGQNNPEAIGPGGGGGSYFSVTPSSFSTATTRGNGLVVVTYLSGSSVEQLSTARA